MTARILSAKPVVEKIKLKLKARCEDLKSRGLNPAMSVVLVGDNPASLSYIRNKKKLCEEVGAKFTLHQLPSTVSEKEFLKLLSDLNNDPGTNGIIVQLPVSQGLKHLDLPNLVVPAKDIDGFHNKNTQQLYEGTTNLKLLLPCTPKGVIHLFKFYEIPVDGKDVVVIGRSLIVGKPLSMLLTNMNATVTLAHSKTKDLKSYTRNADIVIAAMGKPHFFDAGYFDPAKKTVVIDVGMNSLDGKLVGDVNTDAVKDIVEAITPVPGGVGPMTVLSLIENLISATEQQARGNK
jgi:methylenetetrahydrofolate dehydrogenase (NADP+)/methenyltetrahydrofolate cyclohydrolase